MDYCDISNFEQPIKNFAKKTKAYNLKLKIYKNCFFKHTLLTIIHPKTSSWNTPWIAENLARECPDPSGECLFPAYTGVPVTWLGAKQTKIVYQNSDSVLAQINIPNWQFDFDVREEPYIIFLIFQRLYCGQGLVIIYQ